MGLVVGVFFLETLQDPYILNCLLSVASNYGNFKLRVFSRNSMNVLNKVRKNFSVTAVLGTLRQKQVELQSHFCIRSA